MAVQVNNGPSNTATNTLAERIECRFYVAPKKTGLAHALLYQICSVDREHRSEQINSLYFDSTDLDQYARSLSGDFQKDEVRIREKSRSG
jgi:hypothetical protein